MIAVCRILSASRLFSLKYGDIVLIPYISINFIFSNYSTDFIHKVALFVENVAAAMIFLEKERVLCII